MADIRSIERFNNARWNWDKAGYSQAFGGRITPSDVDVIVERKGQFLIVETKEIDAVAAHPFYMPIGQERMYRRLAALPEFTVFYLSGIAELADPHYLRRIGPDRNADIEVDLRFKTQSERHDYLHELFACWYRKADGIDIPHRGAA